MMRLGSLALLLSVSAGSIAYSETGPRCALLGQMAVSNWLELLGELASPDAIRVDRSLTRLSHSTGIYERVGCDISSLEEAFDCVLSDVTPGAPSDRALTCMRRAGLAED